VMESGPGLSFGNMGDASPAGQPANLDGVGSSSRITMTGRAEKSISYLALHLPLGRVTYLKPARWHGQQWVGVELPSNPRLASVVAYSAGGEVAYAVPFSGDEINAWLAPGQRGLARQTARIASGTVHGHRWSYTGYAGPWGICFRGTDGGACSPAYSAEPPRGKLMSWFTCGPVQASLQQWTGQVAPEVSYLKFGMSDGGVQRVVPVTLAGYRYFALVYGHGQKLESWTAYGSSGQVLGSGTVNPKC
jgi:hypothetical protein